MKKSLKTLACVCVCMCAAALCFGKSKKESSKKAPAPLWLTDEGRRSIFPSSDFVSALAHGSSAEEAKNKAAAEISRAIKSSVASETKSRRLMAKDEHGVSINSFLDESASVKSESDLYMLEFTAPVYDGAMGMYACCAYINRSKAFEYVQPALENARRIFPDACQKALSEDDDFRKIIAIKRSHDLLKEFYSVYDFARFIKPQAAQEYQDVDALYFKSLVKLAELKGKVVVSVRALGEGGGEIKECLEKILSGAGFGVSDAQASHTATARTSMEIVKKEKVFATYPAVTIEVARKRDGKFSASYSSKLEKCAGFDESGAKQKAVFELKKDLELNFINKL